MGIERIITQFKRVVEEGRTAADLIAATADIARWLGFRHFAITHHVDLAAADGAIHLHNYPSRWGDYYRHKALGTIDPVHRTSHMTTEGFWWSHMSSLIRLNDRDEQIMRLGRLHGIGEGFTVPNNLPGEACGSCTFAGEAGIVLDPVTQALAQLAGLAAFGAARRLWPKRGAVPVEQRPVLTPQQIACVELVAQGKSDRQIGVILGITEETVATHIKNACERYGVKKRTLLVTLALMDGAIMLSKI